MEKILITGASGLIGKELSKVLVENGYEVIHLLRKKPESYLYRYHLWSPEKNELDETIFADIDHIIHLAGENIGAKRWTKSRKEKLYSSRVQTANLLFEKSKNAHIQTFISASGANIYGTQTSAHIFSEEDLPGNDFLSQLTLDWEKAADQFSSRGARIVKIRTGLVLSEKGGALDKLVLPFKWNVGSKLGDGKQFMPWIHLDDLVQIYLKAIRDKNLSGAYNAVAPHLITNSEFTAVLSKQFGKKLWAPAVPAFIIKLLFGEMGNLVLKGSRVSSEKIRGAQYQFKFSTVEEALNHVLKLNK